MGIKRRHHRRQLRFAKAVFGIAHAEAKTRLQRLIQRRNVRSLKLFDDVVFIPMGKVEIG